MFNTKSVVLFVLGMFTFVGAFILSVVAFDTSSFTTGIAALASAFSGLFWMSEGLDAMGLY